MNCSPNHLPFTGHPCSPCCCMPSNLVPHLTYFSSRARGRAFATTAPASCCLFTSRSCSSRSACSRTSSGMPEGSNAQVQDYGLLVVCSTVAGSHFQAMHACIVCVYNCRHVCCTCIVPRVYGDMCRILLGAQAITPAVLSSNNPCAHAHPLCTKPA